MYSMMHSIVYVVVVCPSIVHMHQTFPDLMKAYKSDELDGNT